MKNIVSTNKIEVKDTNIAVTVNEKNSWIESIIENLSQEFKSVNIVTNNIKLFKKLEETLFEEKGMAITVTNNKRKSLLKADIILNIDFPEEVLNKYIIYDNSIIITLEEKVKIHKKRFNGKIISDYSICLEPNSQIFNNLNKYKYKNFDIKDLTECYIINAPDEIDNIIICN